MQGNGLNEQLDAIKQEILNGMEALESSKAVYEFKKTFMDSKTGKIGQLMKGMKDIAPEDRAEYGKSVNALKEWALVEFEKLDELVGWHYFDDYALIGYALKLKLLERKKTFDKQKGKSEFNGIIEKMEHQILNMEQE